ncbi:hypothetical protein I7I48_03609 [Histoplasma ohiense]|nr:hypothetical protein I7I48_03609 [Histoplasma ohiense (nom. inval.)]
MKHCMACPLLLYFKNCPSNRSLQTYFWLDFLNPIWIEAFIVVGITSPDKSCTLQCAEREFRIFPTQQRFEVLTYRYIAKLEM